MTTRRVPRLVLCLIVGVSLACSRKDPGDTRAARERRGVEAVAEAVRATPTAPSTGQWNQPTLTQRLISAGLAPRPDDSLPSHPDFRVKPVAYRLSTAHLLAWIYPDSIARKSVSATIDTLTAIPNGQPTAWDQPPMFVSQNNLIVVVVGGGERQRERVRLAIEAGLAPRRP